MKSLFSLLLQQLVNMDSQESENISQFTTDNSTANPGDVVDASVVEGSQSWGADVEIEIPEVLKNLENKGVKFQAVPFLNAPSQSRITKDRSIYFSVDTTVTSQIILEAFDAAEIDIDAITGIQRKASNRSWIVTFKSRAAKEAALETPFVVIAGLKVFLGDCENRLVLVKIHEAPAELPDTAVIGRLSHYGRVLSFRRDKIAQHIENGVRTARMALHRTIPANINIAGEPIKIWYPNQPKACRNCGATDHMAKDCSAVRCFNCECPGHRAQECKDSPRCSVCLADNHSMPQCPFLLFSANVDSEPTPPKTEKEKKQERAQRAKEREERQKKLQQQREQQRQQEEQQKLLEKQEQQEQQKQQDQEKQREQQRDEGRRERPRERRDERGRDDREERRDDRRDDRRERDRSDRDYYRDRDGRDRSSRRDYSGSETDDDGWERVKPRRRRYRY